MRAGCLGLEHCEGSEGRDFAVNMDSKENTRNRKKERGNQVFTTPELTIGGLRNHDWDAEDNVD